MSASAPYLRLQGVSKSFGSFTALQDIALDVNEGEFVCFLGPSGCGKTTLLRIIAGLEIQSAGQITQAEVDISNLPPSQRDFGIVFQSYALFPNLTVNKNVAYGLDNTGSAREATSNRVEELLALVGLPDQGDKYPAQLSGGQQQRVALARALAMSPGLLLLDEPLSALDAKVRGHLRHEIKSLQRRLGVTTIMVTHDQEEALTMADRIVVMDHGVVEQVGSPLEIYREPVSPFVANFIGTMNQLPCEVNGAGGVKLGALSLACQDHKIQSGAPAILAIRPEDVIPHGAGARSPGAPDVIESPGNAFDARIEDMEFLGSFFRAELSCEALGESHLLADFSINAVRRMGLETGKDLTVELPADRVRIFSSGAV
ncbi:putative 2-aminoethylphosphonate ABC transporter ATP-binding protein [Pelagibius sp. Alg239-R121]|uniref:putative 2-aminoethylphosphonate ABC transporter ATP-binding protein n=1 Tax=Pelagibius sp. Alg239-R121 TaxID=2993448 RepID=UPI0024A6E068|nr:putative 2-aminoethylphosphonate ABC transporter ATP-binding protein [Pelagibius sp. Alg239-R121]